MYTERHHYSSVVEALPILTVDEVDTNAFRTYRKTAVTIARRLTESDLVERHGIIHTLEGESSFQVGDYLAIGVQGEEYPIRATTMMSTKRQVGQNDSEGWATYETTTTVRAQQIHQPFAVRRAETNDINQGKTGDYFVDTGKRQFIVDQLIFEQTYICIEDKQDARTFTSFLQSLQIVSTHGHLP